MHELIYRNNHLSPKVSCWISANAGTGKTKIVIDRILALLLSNIPPKNILAITFTNSAADEMKQRINTLIEQLNKYDIKTLQTFLANFFEINITNNDLLQYKKTLADLTIQMGELKIQTIHSFCQSLLQDFTIEANLTPGFNIVDENFAKIILNKAREKIFEDEAISGVLDDLISRYQYGYIENILDDIISNRIKILYILGKYDNFSEYIDKIYDFLGIKPLNNYENHIFSEFFDKIDYNFLIQLQTAIENFGSKKESEKITILTKLQKQPKTSINYLSLKHFQEVFCKKDLTFLKNPFTKNVAKNIHNYDNIITKINKDYTDSLNLYHKYELANTSINIIIIAQFFLESYEQIKSEYNLLDYEDLILKSLTLLKSSSYRHDILYNLDYNISHLLVDEAQDVSPWQWEIIKLLLEEFFSNKQENKSFFIVGDEKQSIYSFQGANHRLFGNIKNEFSQKLSYKQETLHQINLTTSYRSGLPILHLVDQIANDANIKTSLTTDDNLKIIHDCARNDIKSKVVLWPEFIAKKPENTMTPWSFPKEIIPKTSIYDEIAKNITNLIADLLAKQNALSATGKKINASDILILCRKRGELYKAIIRNLNLANIQVESDISIKMLDYVLIMDLVSIIRFILFPDDSLNLAGLLKSPIFNLSEDDIFELCHNRDDNITIHDELKKHPKYDNICVELDKIIDLVAILNIEEFYLYIIELYNLRTKYCEIYGKQADRLIKLFLQIIQNFEQHSSNYLEFLEYLLRSNITVQNEITDNIDSVKILSVHASKGLQSPIVILATETYGKNSLKKDFLNFDYQNDLIFANFITTPIEYKEYFNNFSTSKSAEELRLLYVALTRAKDELHIFSLKNHNSDADWYSIIKNASTNITEFKTQNDYIIYETNSNKTLTPIQDEEYNQEPQLFSIDNIAHTKQQVHTATNHVTVNNKTIDIGKIYHELFYFLSQQTDKITSSYLTQYLHKYHPYLTATDLKNIITQTINIYNDPKFQQLFFSADGYNELHLLARIDDQIISGKIDRIAIINDQLHIIDYKLSNNSKLLDKYNKQLNIYKQLVSKNFPNKVIKKFIFFITSKELIAIK